MHCPYCGRALGDGQRGLCPSCGLPIPTAAAETPPESTSAPVAAFAPAEPQVSGASALASSSAPEAGIFPTDLAPEIAMSAGMGAGAAMSTPAQAPAEPPAMPAPAAPAEPSTAQAASEPEPFVVPAAEAAPPAPPVPESASAGTSAASEQAAAAFAIGQPPATDLPSQPPATVQPPAPSLSQPAAPAAYPPGYPYPAPAQGQPPAPGYPPYGYGQPAAPSYPMYGQPAAPSYPMYGQPMYGQPAPGSVPMMPAYGQPAPGSVPFYPQPGMMSPPARKTNVGLIVGIVALVVVLMVAAIGGVLALRGAASPTPNGPPPGATAAAAATATATAGSNVVFHDSLLSNTNGWADDSHCSFQGDGYHVKDGYICYAPAGNFSDSTVSVQVKQVAGDIHYFYGLVVRRTSQGNFYEFDIDSNGKWAFGKVVNGNYSEIVPYVANAAVKHGLNVTNTLKVTASGTHFEFFVNGTQVGQATDATYSSGYCGVAGDDHLEVVFTDFTIATPS